MKRKLSICNKKYFSHKSSIIDEGAKIGDKSKIWHFCQITRQAIIGNNCNIGQNCYIAGRIGNNCKIHP